MADLDEVELARAFRPPVRRGFELTWRWVVAGIVGTAALVGVASSGGGSAPATP